MVDIVPLKAASSKKPVRAGRLGQSTLIWQAKVQVFFNFVAQA